MKADEPELTHGELTKKLTIMWKALSDTERAIYEDLAAKDKSRYKIEMEDCGLKKKLTDAEAAMPIKYRKKFILWSTVERLKIKQTDDTIPNPVMLKKLAEIWQKVPPEEKKIWSDKAKEDRVRYEREMAEYYENLETA